MMLLRRTFLFVLLSVLSILHARGGCNLVAAYDIYAQRGDEIKAVCRVVNSGSEAAGVIDVQYVLWDMSGLNVKAEGVVTVVPYGGIAAGATAELTVRMPPVDELFSGTYTLEVTAVDGRPNTGSYGPYEASVNIVEKIFDRVVVCEEFTGNTCGWCPRGMVGLAMMREKYPDTFIGIGVHVYSADDPLYCASYAALAQMFKGAPSCMMNRKTSSMGDPYTDIERLYQSERAAHSLGRIEMSGEWLDDSTAVRLTTRSEFACNMRNTAYRVAFVVVENNVSHDAQGSYIFQLNYFSGSSAAMGGWELLPQAVVTTYNDVARCITGLDGLAGSEIHEVTPGTLYDYEYTLDIPEGVCRANLEFIALLYDANRSEIVNACRLDANMETPSAVASAEADAVRVGVAGGTVRVSSPQGSSLSAALFSPDGSQVSSASSSAGMVELPAGCAPGVYVLRVSAGSSVICRKLVIR